MTNQTKIEWTDFTVNFWEGCQKVGPGCDHCYAEARDIRFTGGQHWGPGAPRRKVKGGIAKLRKINRDALAFNDQHNRWPRVFCSSLSDVFDNAVDQAWRSEAFTEITAATETAIMLLTKRVGNVFAMIPPGWASPELGGWPAHVGLMITVVNQEEADRDIPKLLDLKARLGIPWVGLSMEPLLGPVDLTYWLGSQPYLPGASTYVGSDGLERQDIGGQALDGIDWVICGGESGHQARPMHPDWARSLRDQCAAAGVPFLFKQWGEYAPTDIMSIDDLPQLRVLRSIGRGEDRLTHTFPDLTQMGRIGKKAAGRLLDGRTWDQFPEVLT